MCALIVIFLVFSGLWGVSSSVQLGATPAEPVPQVESPQLLSCKGQSLEQDISEIHAIVGDTFSGDDWRESVSTNEYRTYVTWTNDSLGGLAFLDYQYYDCGVTPQQIDDYFDDENFSILLSNYQSFQQTDFCEAGDVRLYEFDVLTMQDFDYKLRYWVWQASPTRVAALQLTFPLTEQAALAEYAGSLFPDLPTCTPAAG